jgi:2,5-diamino-6-(ribosylamino)-4(3H)-pyrimidinone 5'-phosphate reductase
MQRPITTLFLLSSVDGKISTGDTDVMDVDSDFPNIPNVSEGLQQYYDLEMKTDLFSLNSGRVFAKIGFNQKTDVPNKLPVTFIVIDNKPHLNASGVSYLSQKAKEVIFVTTNLSHPVYSLRNSLFNVHVIPFIEKIDFITLFKKLRSDFSVDRLTIQAGGTLNTELMRSGLIDHISLVVAPVMVGGKNTSSVMDGESLHSTQELGKIKPLKLESAEPLNHSYLHLRYKVLN